ncbi:unnamed protein product [Onchocerca flexuosa]|uniref:LEM domain-containing protein n=1 Tax=Onchocerca flexuosa TaxID=387005 RepID=A0A183HK21_9BILA|nr:unnamed protein product [Onchocerca flexuosa]
MTSKMRRKDGLLLDSDDSDIPDLDLPTANVRKERSGLFSKARQNSVIVRQQNCSIQTVLMLLLFAVVVAIVFLGFFTSYIWSQLQQLHNDPKHEVVTRELEIIKQELNRIKLDIDMLRMMTSSPGTSTWNASSLLYTRLEDIESQISDIADKIQVKSHFISPLIFVL